MSYIGVQAQNHVSPAFHREVVTPDGSASFFDLVQDVPGFNADNVLVVVNNVVQHPFDSYTIKADANGNPRRLDFAGSVPASTDVIYVTHRGVGSLNMTPAAGTVDSVALADNLRSGVVNSFTGSQHTVASGNSTFTLTEAPLNAQSIMVYVNGVYQKPSTNYSVSGTTLTFVGQVVSTDEIDVHHLSIRTGVTHVADGSVTSAKLDTNLSLDGNLTVGGNFTVNGTTTTIDTIVQSVDKLEIGASSTDYGAKINQTSTGNILQLQDGGTDVFVVADGGTISTDITMATNKKIKQKGEFLTHSLHRAWVLGS